MNNQYFENIVELLQDKKFEFVCQGLTLLETCLDDDPDKYIWGQICEVNRIFEDFRHDTWHVDKYPTWLRPAKFRRYVALWILGYRAKVADPNVRSVTSLSVNEPEFPTFPETLQHLTWLERFSLNRSKWTKLPDMFAGFTALRDLNLFDNELMVLPPSLVHCTSLTDITIRHNPIDNIPDFICDLHQLRTLNLSATGIQRLPERIGNLENLHTLELQDSQVSSLPDSIGALDHLKTLDLSRSAIKTLPDTIGDLSRLEDCYLSVCKQLESLPKTIRVIRCGSALIYRLWDDFMHLPNLERFRLSDWQKPRKQEAKVLNFGQFPKLKHLEMSWGVFDLDSVLECKQLEFLKLSGDQTALPESIGQLTHLKHLELRHSKVSVLPDSISNLHQLEYISFPADRTGFDSSIEIRKFDHLLGKHKGVAKNTKKYNDPVEIRWQLYFDNAPNDTSELLRRKWTAQIFEEIEGTEWLESLHVSLDRETDFPDISQCVYLDNMTIDSTETILLSQLKRLTVVPCLKRVTINADVDVFPAQLIRELLGTVQVKENRGKTELVFERSVSIQKFSSALETLKLELAKEQGVLEQLRHLTYKGDSVPQILEFCRGLEQLSLPNVPADQIPLAVLELPNLVQLTGKDTNYPNQWPVWEVSYSDIETYSYLSTGYQNTRILTMRQCLLKELPKSVLTFGQLRRLDISFNRLAGLPSTVGSWTALEYINLAANPLVTIPSSLLGLPALKEVILPKHLSLNSFQTEYPHIQFSHLEN